MKGQYFKKDKKAQIYIRVEGEKDIYGVTQKGAYYPVGESLLWCYARQNYQRIGFTSGIAHINEEGRLFVFNNNVNIVQGAFVFYKEAWYTIIRVDTTDDYNGDMFVYVDDTPEGDIPRQSSIRAYDPTKLRS